MEEKITYEIDIEFELCCDTCNEIIHNHFCCPICDNYSGIRTHFDADLHDERYKTHPLIIQCEICGSRFKCIGQFTYFDEDLRWEKVN